MIKRTRTKIFLALFFLFLVTAPITVFYCLGWRFDWKTKKITQPGIFYFKVWPRSVEIYVNGKFKKRTDIFFGSALLEDLSPKTYNIKIEKEGYYPWEKNLEIKKRKVTEAKNVILIPQDPGTFLISKNIENFFFLPDNKKVILKEVALKEQEASSWELKIFDTEESIKSHLISQSDLNLGSSSPVELINIKFSFDSKKAIMKLGAKEKIYHYLLDLETSEIISLDYLKNTEELFFHPDKDKFLAKSGYQLREFDFKTEKGLVIAENIIAITAEKNNIYYLSKEGFLVKVDELPQSTERLNIVPIEIEEETKYDLKIKNNNILLKKNNSLFIFNQEKMIFEKLLDSNGNFVLSPDLKKICYFNKHEIWIKFIEKAYDQPAREPGEELFINRFSEEIGDVFWYTNHYLIFSLKDKIKIAEIDNRDKINIVDIVKFKEPKIYFANKKLYILSENTLYSSEELTP